MKWDEVSSLTQTKIRKMFLCYTKYVTPACSEQKPFWKTEATFNQTLKIKVVYYKVMSKNTIKNVFHDI